MARTASAVWRIVSVIAAILVVMSSIITLGLAAADLVLLKASYEDYSYGYSPNIDPTDFPVQLTIVVLGAVTVLLGIVALVLLLLQVIPLVVGILCSIFVVFWFVLWVYIAQDLGTHGFSQTLSQCSRYYSGNTCASAYVIVAFEVFCVITDLLLIALAIVSFVVASKKKKGLFASNNTANSGAAAYTGGFYNTGDQPGYQQSFQPNKTSPFSGQQGGPFQPPPQQQAGWVQQSQSPPPNMQQQTVYQPQPQHYSSPSPAPQQYQSPQVYIGAQQ